jgi:hypothetical protein
MTTKKMASGKMRLNAGPAATISIRFQGACAR